MIENRGSRGHSEWVLIKGENLSKKPGDLSKDPAPEEF